MKKWILRPLLVFLVISVAWHVFEFLWDRDLFPKTNTKMSQVNVGAKKAQSLIEEKGDLQIVDVRPEKSFLSNHIPGAINVRFAKGELDMVEADKLDRKKPILLYCDGGFRSRLSLTSFREAGFEEIYHLHRGLMSWRMRGGECESGSGENPEE